MPAAGAVKLIRCLFVALLVCLTAFVTPGRVWAVTYSDDFDRANSTNLGANWNESGSGINVLSNMLTGSGISATWAFWTTGHTGPDHYNEVAAIAYPGTGGASLFVRAASAAETGNHYEAFWTSASSGTWTIRKRVSGTSTVIGTFTSQGGPQGNTVRFEAEGTTLRIVYNISDVRVSMTDSAVTTGNYVGFRIDNGNTSFDNFVTALMDEPPPNACSDVDLTVAFKDLGETTFTTLPNPAGTTALNGSTVRLTLDRTDETEATSFAFRWSSEGQWFVLGGGLDAEYPLVFEVTKRGPALDGGPSDLGSAELLCRWDGISTFRTLAGTGTWDSQSTLDRPCSNITWYWPPQDTMLGDGTVYPVRFTLDKSRADGASLTGLYVDHDDEDLTAPAGRLAHFDAGDEDTFDIEVGTVWSGSVGGTVLMSLDDSGSYDWSEDSYVTGLFGITLTGGASAEYETASFGVWCTDDVGSPILYRFDSSYVALHDFDPDGSPSDGAGRSLGACFGDSLGAMEWDNPRSWVTGAGRMGVCLVEYMFVPEDGYVEDQVDTLMASLEEQLPFSLAFMLIDFAVDLNDEMEASSASGCFDTGGELSFGTYGDVPIDDVCLGGGGGSSAGSLLDISSQNRQLIAALMVTAIWFAVVRHAISTIRGVVAGDGPTQGSAYE